METTKGRKDETMTPKLLPCPFCGHEAVFCTMWYLPDDPDEIKNLRVACTFCGAVGPETWDAGCTKDWEGEEKIAEIWNRRAEVRP